MKVKELTKYLCDFNPEAEILYNSNGKEYPLRKYAWSDGVNADCSEANRNIEQEKLHAKSLSFVSAAEFDRGEQENK